MADAYECYHVPPRKIKFPKRTMTWLDAFNTCLLSSTLAAVRLFIRWMSVVEGRYPPTTNSTDSSRAQWMAWENAGASMVLRPNALYYLGFGMPFDASAALQSDIAFTGQHSMVGASFDTMLANHGTVGPTYYVLARQLWDPSVEVGPLVDEYFSGASVIFRSENSLASLGDDATCH